MYALTWTVLPKMESALRLYAGGDAPPPKAQFRS